MSEERLKKLIDETKSSIKPFDLEDKYHLQVMDILLNGYFGKEIHNFIKNGFYLSITEELVNPNLHDLQIIDNMHDIFSDRAKMLKQNNKNSIRNHLYNFCKSEKFKNKFKPSKRINVNSVANKIYFNKQYGLHFFNWSTSDTAHILPNLISTDKYEKYHETNGIFLHENYICPYKSSIDQESCSCDTFEVRKNLKYNFDITHYSENKLYFSLDGKNVNLFYNKPSQIILYKPFFREIQPTTLKSIPIIINNQKLYVYNSPSQLTTLFNSHEDIEQIIAGLHLKLCADYSQVYIFNEFEKFKYFNTTDNYCYLFSALVSKPNKFILFEKTGGFLKIKLDDKIYRCEIIYKPIGALIKDIDKIIRTYPVRLYLKKMKERNTTYKTLYMTAKEIYNNMNENKELLEIKSIPLITEHSNNIGSKIQYKDLLNNKDKYVDEYGIEEYEIKLKIAELIYLYHKTVFIERDFRDKFQFIKLVSELNPYMEILIDCNEIKITKKLFDLLCQFHQKMIENNFYELANNSNVKLLIKQEDFGLVLGFLIREPTIFDSHEFDFSKTITEITRGMKNVINHTDPDYVTDSECDDSSDEEIN